MINPQLSQGLNLVVLFVDLFLIAYILRRKRSSEYSVILLTFAVALSSWSFASAFTDVLLNIHEKLFWALVFVGSTIIPLMILAFSVKYTRRDDLLTPLSMGILFLEPLAIQFIWWNPAYHELLFVNGKGVIGNAQLLFWLNAIYTNSIVAVSVALLAITLVYSRQTYKWQMFVVMASTAIPVLVSMLSLPDVSFFRIVDLKPLAFTATLIVFSYGLVYRGMLGIVPIARDIVVEYMPDGWMMIDAENRIVDLNQTAEKVLGVKREKLFGKSAESILSNWGLLIDSKQETEIPGSINYGDEWRFVSVRITPFADHTNREIGKTILWRDMTERRKLEETRQRARADMFILLHSISGAASRAVDLHEFLSESILQVMYSFQGNACAIFLLDDIKQADREKRRLLLSSQQGYNQTNISRILSIGDSPQIDNVVLARQPIMIEDAELESTTPGIFNLEEPSTLILFPLSINNEPMGLFALSRKDGQSFSDDEMTRLGVVVEEIASSIHGGRRRQLAIALAERQRLVRDLHDSVTQKLYGLVALTEAAKSGIETGETQKLPAMMDRIGDNARQALKEMRLFLHEMKPVDLQSIGLTAALLQRLASVEGRSDINHTFVADEEFQISIDKQVALYYIAQEALNNIMKHARAKTVHVQIKNISDSVILSIQDDGCGFVPDCQAPGGMGLRNMQERAQLAGGKLEIESSPARGTCVRVSVRCDVERNG
jgi:PAS domain S-box-containing protein